MRNGGGRPAVSRISKKARSLDLNKKRMRYVGIRKREERRRSRLRGQSHIPVTHGIERGEWSEAGRGRGGDRCAVERLRKNGRRRGSPPQAVLPVGVEVLGTEGSMLV